MDVLNAAASFFARQAHDANWFSGGMQRFSSLALTGTEKIAPSGELHHLAAETRNKFFAYHCFRNPQGFVPNSGDWATQISACREHGAYTSIWLMEGAAARLTSSRGGSVSLRDLVDVPDPIAETKMALHTGAATVYARNAVDEGVRSGDRAGLTSAIEKFLESAESLSQPGYRRCTVEAIGLVARNLYPQVFTEISGHLASRSEEDYMLFWHGSGRGLYFNPMHLTPISQFRRWMLDKSLSSAPNAAAVNNVVAGFFWALTLVNIRNPEVVANFLRSLPSSRWKPHAEAIRDGVGSALVVWKHLTREDQLAEAFIEHQIAGGGARESVEGIVETATARLSSYGDADRRENRIADLYLFDGVR